MSPSVRFRLRSTERLAAARTRSRLSGRRASSLRTEASPQAHAVTVKDNVKEHVAGGFDMSVDPRGGREGIGIQPGRRWIVALLMRDPSTESDLDLAQTDDAGGSMEGSSRQWRAERFQVTRWRRLHRRRFRRQSGCCGRFRLCRASGGFKSVLVARVLTRSSWASEAGRPHPQSGKPHRKPRRRPARSWI